LTSSKAEALVQSAFEIQNELTFLLLPKMPKPFLEIEE